MVLSGVKVSSTEEWVIETVFIPILFIIIISRLFLVHLHCIDCLVCTLDPNHTAYQIHILR